jgi:hypothetical protein
MSGYLPLLRDYVREGGGLAMIGGSLSFDGGGYAETALAEVLPVRMRPSDGRGAAVVQGDFSPEPVLKYRHHPLLELYPESTQIEAAFKALAPFTGMNELLGARDGAIVLLEHPEHKNARGDRLPVLTVGGFGKGRTLAFATDTSWHWSMPTAGKGGDSSVYDRFWDRAVRFLTRDPLLDPARVGTDRESYTPEASMLVDVLARDESYRPLTNADVQLRVMGPQGKQISATPLHTDDSGEARVRVRAPELPGSYSAELWVGAKMSARAPFLVELSGVELARPRARAELLSQLAKQSGGRFFADPEAAPDLSALDASRTTSLGTERHAPFSNPLWACLALTLVMLEWWLRRRWGER